MNKRNEITVEVEMKPLVVKSKNTKDTATVEGTEDGVPWVTKQLITSSLHTRQS
jgi:hypothetical protein